MLTRARKRQREDEAQRARARPPPVLDPALCSLLPRSVVEKNLMPFITHTFTSREDLIQAVDEYVANPSTFCYRIGLWDVSGITDFSNVFDTSRNPRLEHFNEDLSGWDVSNGTSFGWMFYECASFNGDVSSWDVSNATDLDGMFAGCQSFNSDLSSWDVSKATDLYGMFLGFHIFQ
eukprot:CAMPEP_0194065858 /NCGR_PEP_ID=MMETSP0009_2-20130614/85699_1 /TAXON_ID=210454 /ORGANISM="Grammatophora oceanica, Strain CCMP 410" /LENGTH=176 /DNA_ID=CAMNT_0038718749 /DNA_START=127 /DNA_END=657 /DNA_ORIENTATION=-